jgi:exosome complex RNA-binding protein Rrp4
LGEKFKYDLNIGYNGKIWVYTERNIDTIFILNALERLCEMGES